MTHGSQPMNAQSQPMTPNVPPLKITIWGATDVGREREGNEDSIFPNSAGESIYTPKAKTIERNGHLMIVADGVGGAQAGSEASQWAIRRAVEYYYEQPGRDIGEELRNAVAHANNSLTQYLQSTGIREAGCTMSAAVIHNNTLYVANVGDSRVYHLREGKIYQITVDHTLTQQKIKLGHIRPEDAEMDPDRNVLTRSLGAMMSVPVDLFTPIALEPGDRILLCSDGLTDMLSDEEIRKLALNGSPQRATQKLIATANRNGGLDNISVIVAQAGGKARGNGTGVVGGLTQLSPAQQKKFLRIFAIIVTVIILGMAGYVGWSMFIDTSNNNSSSSDLTATATATITPTPETGAIVGTATASPTLKPTDTVPSGQATSTPAPSSTPTVTPIPDADNDGVPDAADDCPNIAGAQEFAGCPDTDGDGIRDIDDNCPGRAGLEAFAGCPDQDGDGIPYPQDECPDQPAPDQPDGCPPPTPSGGGGDGGGGDDGGGDDGSPPPTNPPPDD